MGLFHRIPATDHRGYSFGRRIGDLGYSTWKLAVRYAFNHKGHAQVVWGAHDVFNPYVLQSPFLQLDLEHELTGERLALYSYVRYQYDHQLSLAQQLPGVGVRVHVVK